MNGLYCPCPTARDKGCRVYGLVRLQSCLCCFGGAIKISETPPIHLQKTESDRILAEVLSYLIEWMLTRNTHDNFMTIARRVEEDLSIIKNGIHVLFSTAEDEEEAE